MTDLVWAVGVTAASAGIMWFTCVRPMRRGHCGPLGPTTPGAAQQLAALRREVAELRGRRDAAARDTLVGAIGCAAPNVLLCP